MLSSSRSGVFVAPFFFCLALVFCDSSDRMYGGGTNIFGQAFTFLDLPTSARSVPRFDGRHPFLAGGIGEESPRALAADTRTRTRFDISAQTTKRGDTEPADSSKPKSKRKRDRARRAVSRATNKVFVRPFAKVKNWVSGSNTGGDTVLGDDGEDDDISVEEMRGIALEAVEEIKDEIKEKAKEAATKEILLATTALEEIAEAATSAAEEFAQKAQNFTDTATHKVEEFTEEFANFTDTATHKVEEFTQKAQSAADSAKEAVAQALHLPTGERWAVSSPDTDLSGNWKLVLSEDFKKSYDQYLQDLGQPLPVRSFALSIIGLTREEMKQSDHGRSLWIKGANARGIWERTIKASGSDFDADVAHGDDFPHERVQIVTADGEKVEAEGWWEKKGTVHKSWLRGGKKYGGGDFSSKRYINSDGHYVCETMFHPRNNGQKKASVTWTFERDQN